MAIDEQTLLDCLRQDPQFLHRHAAELGIRFDEAKIRSFNQGSLDALRHKTERMAAQLAQMLDDAETNRQLSAKLIRFNQQLLRANTLGQLWQAASDSLQQDFGLPYHSMRLLQKPANAAHLPVALDAGSDPALQTAWDTLEAPRCSHHLPEAVAALLPAEPVLESFLQLPVWLGEDLLAVVVIGHPDADHFHPDLETELVSGMADSLAIAMGRIMGLSA